jgi:hypothetical protein
MAPYNPPNSHYVHIKFEHFPKADVQKLIDTKFLYKITIQYNLYYVWFNIESKNLELWGSYDSLHNLDKEYIFKQVNDFVLSF